DRRSYIPACREFRSLRGDVGIDWGHSLEHCYLVFRHSILLFARAHWWPHWGIRHGLGTGSNSLAEGLLDCRGHGRLSTGGFRINLCAHAGGIGFFPPFSAQGTEGL